MQRALLVCFGFLSIHKEVGGGFPTAPPQPVGLSAAAQARLLRGQPGGCPSQSGCQGPTSGSGHFLHRVGTHHVRPSVSLFLTKNHQARRVLTFHFPDWETETQRGQGVNQASPWPPVHSPDPLMVHPNTQCLKQTKTEDQLPKSWQQQTGPEEQEGTWNSPQRRPEP